MEASGTNPPVAPQPYGPNNSSRKRSYIFDWALVVVCAILAGALYSRPPVGAGRLLFRVPNGGDPLVNPDAYYAYPNRGEIIPTWGSALIGIGVNVVTVTVAQFWVRDMRDWHHGILGTAVALSVSTLFQVSIKVIIGGMRPTFLDICKPDITGKQGEGVGGIYYDKSVCTGDQDKINDALESFPSGHSNAAFATFLFLALYLNAKLKLWGVSRGSGQAWKIVLVFAPLWGACVLSLTRYLDHQHNWYDILAGSIIGIFFALAAYRAYYTSFFHPFYNHIPLLDNTLGPHGVPPPYDDKGRAIPLAPMGPANV